MNAVTLLVIMLVVVQPRPCAGSRILAVLPYPGKSHYIFYSAVLRALSLAGHHIVEYSPFPPKNTTQNYTHVQIYNSYTQLFEKVDFEAVLEERKKYMYFGMSALNAWKFTYNLTEETFQNDNIQKLLESKEHFDLVITTATFGQESMLVFGHKFSAPTVSLQALMYSCSLDREAGNSLSITTIPDALSFSFTDQMTFTERLRNFISITSTLFMYYYSHLPKQDALIKKYYKRPRVPYLGEMVTNVSLTLVTNHPTSEYPHPYSPNIVPIGGIIINTDRQDLPQDISNFLDSAKDGVIYFSFGTIVPAKTMPREVLQIFVNVFQMLPQKVLWKIDLDDFRGLPQNVRIIKWVPQLGVLMHPNCKVFITHGGLFGLQEAMYAGVPTVGIPFFIDQPFNTRFSEHLGISVKLELEDISEESLYLALNSVLIEPKYRENARRLSNIFRDQPIEAAVSAVWWVEYVMRHRGAPHLRPVAATLPWYSLALLDLLVATTVILLIAFLLLTKLLFALLNHFKKEK